MKRVVKVCVLAVSALTVSACKNEVSVEGILEERHLSLIHI